jgi:hypothetical protein
MARFREIFEPCCESLEQYAPSLPKILVRDSYDISAPRGWVVIQGPEEFSYSGNRNLGWRAVDPDSDLFDLGDDVRLIERSTVEQLQEIAYSDRNVGILSPKIIGGAGNPMQNDPSISPVTYTSMRIPFIATYIKREVIQSVGYMDEQFSGYGFDDTDYCRRTHLAGYGLGITPCVSVKHGALGYRLMSTSLKKWGGDTSILRLEMAKNQALYLKKWGDVTREWGAGQAP